MNKIRINEIQKIEELEKEMERVAEITMERQIVINENRKQNKAGTIVDDKRD